MAYFLLSFITRKPPPEDLDLSLFSLSLPSFKYLSFLRTSAIRFDLSNFRNSLMKIVLPLAGIWKPRSQDAFECEAFVVYFATLSMGFEAGDDGS